LGTSLGGETQKGIKLARLGLAQPGMVIQVLKYDVLEVVDSD